MKEIILTQGKVALVDDEDFERLSQFKWCASREKKHWYATRNVIVPNGKRGKIRMHREIMSAPKDVQVDHRNNAGLDNCKENLRLATNQQNGFNRNDCNKNNSLGIKGVSWNRNVKKFRATISVNGKDIHLGYFNVLGDADSAYRIAEVKYFGEFARNTTYLIN